MAYIVQDNFGRTSNNTWGNADTGGAYTLTGTAANFDVASGVGTISNPAAGNTRTAALLSSASTLNAKGRVRVKSDKASVGGNQWLFVKLRRRLPSGEYAYAIKVRRGTDNKGWVAVSKYVNNVETQLSSEIEIPSYVNGANSEVWLAYEVGGASPTTLRAKAWEVGDSEPGSWQIDMTDSDADLQQAGTHALTTFIGGSTSNAPVLFTIDEWSVESPIEEHSITYTESGVIADALTRSGAHAATLAESGAISDALTRSGAHGVTNAETATAADTLALSSARRTTYTETASATDARAQTAQHSASISESSVGSLALTVLAETVSVAHDTSFALSGSGSFDVTVRAAHHTALALSGVSSDAFAQSAQHSSQIDEAVSAVESIGLLGQHLTTYSEAAIGADDLLAYIARLTSTARASVSLSKPRGSVSASGAPSADVQPTTRGFVTINDAARATVHVRHKRAEVN